MKNTRMKLTIAAVETSPESLSFPSLGFGRVLKKEWRDGFVFSRYVMTVAVKDFVQRFSPIYNTCVEELKQDDEITGEFCPPYSGAACYPSIEALLYLPEENRMEVIDSWLLEKDILRLYLPEGAANAVWTVASLDSFSVQGSEIRIGGQAAQKRLGKI